MRFNERFIDLAGHYGFTPHACRPYRARTKGKDERMVGYIKHNFFVRYRKFESFTHMNQLALTWLQEEADLRLQGTVKEIVKERFLREELNPLPLTRYDTSYHEQRLAQWDGYINVGGRRYSIPDELRGMIVTVRIGLDGELIIMHEGQKVATHRLHDTKEWSTVPGHHAALWGQSVEHRDLSVYEEVLCN